MQLAAAPDPLPSVTVSDREADLNSADEAADDDEVISALTPRVRTGTPQPSEVDPVDLTVVMPVYNEEASLGACGRSWTDALDGLGIDYRLLVIDDGSSDGTLGVLSELGAHPRVLGVTKTNEGHGPTILRGYRLAAATSTWVFQVDSDDEIPASAFASIWAARDGLDAVFGIRTGRDQPPDRKVISKVAALTARLLLRGRVTDVNVPYRLMRADALGPVLDALPADTFAPNVIISGALGRDPDRFTEVRVPHQDRAAGEVSIVGWGAVKAALRSFGQTVRLARAIR